MDQSDGGGAGRDDALMYAIVGEKAPDSMADTDEMAEATATVSTLRRGLAALGAELGAASPASATDRRPTRTRAKRIWTRPWVPAGVTGAVVVALAGGYILSRPDT